MHTMQQALGTGILAVALAGCSGQSGSGLPTATPPPIQPSPTPTATFLPPPTVTPFPTATERGAVDIVPPSDGSPVLTQVAGGPSATPVAPTAIPTTAAPSDTPTPTPPPIAIPQGTTLNDKVFTADFFQGWPPADFPTVKMGIVNGQYVITAGPSDAGVRSSGAVNQHNMVQQIELTLNACPQQTGFGMRFREKDSSNYYRISIFCDDTWAAGAVINGSVAAIGSGSLLAGSTASGGTHTLGTAAFNQGYTFYFDGQQIGTASDASLDQGDVAFYAFSQGTQVISVAFDNWQVWSLR